LSPPPPPSSIVFENTKGATHSRRRSSARSLIITYPSRYVYGCRTRRVMTRTRNKQPARSAERTKDEKNPPNPKRLTGGRSASRAFRTLSANGGKLGGPEIRNKKKRNTWPTITILLSFYREGHEGTPLRLIQRTRPTGYFRIAANYRYRRAINASRPPTVLVYLRPGVSWRILFPEEKKHRPV